MILLISNGKDLSKWSHTQTLLLTSFPSMRKLAIKKRAKAAVKKCFYLVLRPLVSVWEVTLLPERHRSLLMYRIGRPWAVRLLFAVLCCKATLGWANLCWLSFILLAATATASQKVVWLASPFQGDLFSGSSDFCSMSFSRLEGNLSLGWQSPSFSSVPQ